MSDAPEAVPLPPVEGRVRFEDVSFAYVGQHTVLYGVSMEVQPGQVIALLGATGSGKSTIINLIPRFYDPTDGRILIDGHDIRQVTLDSLRSQIGIVLQETILFVGTHRENIAFGGPAPPASDGHRSGQSRPGARLHRRLCRNGYDTQVGERGVTLSGGQKQRIALARALLTDPCILILDDATASVDTETERLHPDRPRPADGRTAPPSSSPTVSPPSAAPT